MGRHTGGRGLGLVNSLLALSQALGGALRSLWTEGVDIIPEGEKRTKDLHRVGVMLSFLSLQFPVVLRFSSELKPHRELHKLTKLTAQFTCCVTLPGEHK